MPECAQAEPCQTRTSALPIYSAAQTFDFPHRLGAAVGGNSCAGHRLPHRSHPPGLGPRPGHRSPAGGGSIQTEVDALVKPLLASGEIYGMVVGVVDPGWRHTDLPLRTNRKARRPAATGHGSLFQIGSVSKLFVEALLAQLVEEGQLRYEDTVRSDSADQRSVSAQVGELTLYELATHTSGLSREPFTLTQLGVFISYLVTGRQSLRPPRQAVSLRLPAALSSETQREAEVLLLQRRHRPARPADRDKDWPAGHRSNPRKDLPSARPE